MKQTLWTKNFTIITLGTVISSIGYAALNLVLSFVVFTHTQSTFLSGVFGAVSLIPELLLPLFVSTFFDRISKKKVIVILDFINGCLNLIFGFYVLQFHFQFQFYLLFSLIGSSISSIYQISYQSLYPQLIPKGFAQKGYTVSSMIYPTVTILASPLASALYTKIGIAPILIMYGILLWIASFFEHFITVKETQQMDHFSIQTYTQDMKDTLTYLKQEKGIRNIYMSMPFSQGFSEGSEPLIIAYFSTTPGLSLTLYSFLLLPNLSDDSLVE